MYQVYVKHVCFISIDMSTSPLWFWIMRRKVTKLVQPRGHPLTSEVCRHAYVWNAELEVRRQLLNRNYMLNIFNQTKRQIPV